MSQTRTQGKRALKMQTTASASDSAPQSKTSKTLLPVAMKVQLKTLQTIMKVPAYRTQSSSKIRHMNNYLRVSSMKSRRGLQLRNQLLFLWEVRFKSDRVDLQRMVVCTSKDIRLITINSHIEGTLNKTRSKTWTMPTITTTTSMIKMTTTSCLQIKHLFSSSLSRHSSRLMVIILQWYLWWERSRNCYSNKFSKTISPCNTVTPIKTA